MVTRSLFTGVSGLQSHLSKMDVLSDNLANVNTPGFKKSQVVFQSFLSQQLSAASRPDDQRGGTNPQSIGLGVQLGGINLDMTQGQLERTGINTDLAVQGEGFFEVRESGGSTSLFTRSGSFQIDANGRLTDPATGNVVQGFNASVVDGEIQFNPDAAPVDDIQITSAMEVIPGDATTFQDLVGNLDASAEKGLDSVNVSFENAGARFEFERYHPTKRQYRFSAVWTENPPSGRQNGDSVIDRITGEEIEGIMELDDNGQVIGIYDNPDNSGMNSIARVEVGRENAGEYTIDGERMIARNQNGMFSDLEPDITDQFRMRVTDSDIIEEDLDAGNDLGAGTNDFDVANPGNFLIGDTVVINDNDSDAFTTKITNIDGNTITIADEAPDDYTSAEGATVTRNPRFVMEWQDVDGEWNEFENSNHGNMNHDFVFERETSDGSTRVGELRVDAGFWRSDAAEIDPGENDVVYFQVHSGNDNEIFDQIGEEVRPEQRWGGRGTDVFRASTPVAAPENVGGGSLNSVFNYVDTAALDGLDNSTVLNNIPNKEFEISNSVLLNDAWDGEGADQEVSGGAANATFDIEDAEEEFEVGDTLEFYKADGTREIAEITGITGTQIEIDTSDWDAGTTFDGALGDSFGLRGGFLVNNLSTDENDEIVRNTLYNQNGNRFMRAGDDNRLFTNDDPDPDNELGIEIASENWSGTFRAGDEIDFTLTEARSLDNARPFMIVRDGDGMDTALLAPLGESGQPGNINFGPNLTDTSGILGSELDDDGNTLRAGSGETGETTLRDEDAIQVAASSDVFDSLGAQHTLTYRFERKAEGEWMWHALDPTPVDPDDPEVAGYGRVFFDGRGNLDRTNIFPARTAIDQPPPGPGGDLEVRQIYFNPPEAELQSDPLAPDGENPDVGARPVSILPNFSDVTQFAGDTDIEITDQDGTSRGRLQTLDFDSAGVLNGAYDNGETKELAQLVLTNFRNPSGLEKRGSTYFARSANSGLPTRGRPGQGGRGSITPGALERSNVDLSEQFTQLIGTQRGFQANTRTIRTADQMIQELLQLR